MCMKVQGWDLQHSKQIPVTNLVKIRLTFSISFSMMFNIAPHMKQSTPTSRHSNHLERRENRTVRFPFLIGMGFLISMSSLTSDENPDILPPKRAHHEMV